MKFLVASAIFLSVGSIAVAAPLNCPSGSETLIVCQGSGAPNIDEDINVALLVQAMVVCRSAQATTMYVSNIQNKVSTASVTDIAQGPVISAENNSYSFELNRRSSLGGRPIRNFYKLNMTPKTGEAFFKNVICNK